MSVDGDIDRLVWRHCCLSPHVYVYRCLRVFMCARCGKGGGRGNCVLCGVCEVCCVLRAVYCVLLGCIVYSVLRIIFCVSCAQSQPLTLQLQQ